MYRYRESNSGSTQRSISAYKHLSKLGKVLYVKGYRYNNYKEKVIVVGDKGSARFDGLCWGYKGEGTRGLVQLLTKLGVSTELAEHIAFNTPRLNENGVDWIAKQEQNGWLYVTKYGRKNV